LRECFTTSDEATPLLNSSDSYSPRKAEGPHLTLCLQRDFASKRFHTVDQESADYLHFLPLILLI